jgi:outer membrane protein OmpA-like peptidoglycan-associated protein
MLEQRRLIVAAREKRSSVVAAVVCMVLARGVLAAEPLLDERNIDEDAIIHALKPEMAGGEVSTHGLVHKSVAAASGMVPTASASINLLITFGPNSTTLTDQARAALDTVAHAMESSALSEFKFRIEGHADPRGNPAANMKLSAARAAAVLDYLTRRDGVAPERLMAVGKGSTEPMNTRDPTAPENRRVTIVRLPG